MSSDSVVALEGVSKCYHTYRKPFHRLIEIFTRQRRLYEEFWALKDINLEIGAGETVGIVGRNGSGKSTLLQLVVGTLAPTTGSVRCTGRISAILELGAGFNPEFTGIENARLNASIVGMSGAEIEERMPDIVAFSELEDFIDKPVKTYSSGMYIRLAFSVVISMSPDILVIDEALAVGDSRFQRKCFRKLDELRNGGTTILFVTHATDTVISHCDRAVFMKDGAIVKVGEPKEVVNNYLESMFHMKSTIDKGARAKGMGLELREDRMTVDPEIDTCKLRRTYNDTEYEWGNGEVRILDYLLLDAAGKPLDSAVDAGTEISLLAAVYCYQAQSNLIYGLTIKTVDGTAVFGTNTDRQKIATEPLSPGETAFVKFTLKLDLVSSEYFFSLGVVSRNEDGEDTVLHRRYDLFRLKVQDDNRSFGYASLPVAVKISKDREALGGC
ncbi:MAG: ABC transporter ATP-binding protein [Arenicellales bacterium]